MARDISDPSTFTGPGKKATPKKKPATKKGKMPAGLLERFKSKAAKAKTGIAEKREERAAKRAERMGNKADALNTKKSERTKNVEKLVAARKAKKASASKKKKAGTGKTTKGIKHVGQERTADGKAKPKGSEKIVTSTHKEPREGQAKKKTKGLRGGEQRKRDAESGNPRNTHIYSRKLK